MPWNFSMIISAANTAWVSSCFHLQLPRREHMLRGRTQTILGGKYAWNTGFFITFLTSSPLRLHPVPRTAAFESWHAVCWLQALQEAGRAPSWDVTASPFYHVTLNLVVSPPQLSALEHPASENTGGELLRWGSGAPPPRHLLPSGLPVDLNQY